MLPATASLLPNQDAPHASLLSRPSRRRAIFRCSAGRRWAGRAPSLAPLLQPPCSPALMPLGGLLNTTKAGEVALLGGAQPWQGHHPRRRDRPTGLSPSSSLLVRVCGSCGWVCFDLLIPSVAGKRAGFPRFGVITVAMKMTMFPTSSSRLWCQTCADIGLSTGSQHRIGCKRIPTIPHLLSIYLSLLQVTSTPCIVFAYKVFVENPSMFLNVHYISK
jgi:hypothetical protein